MNDLKYWNAINLCPKIGPLRFRRLYNYFANMEEAFKASLEELKKAKIEEEVAGELIARREEIDPDKEWEKLEKENIKLIIFKDEKYPKLLKEIYDPPALLYLKGDLNLKDEFTLAIVGTRKVTSYGKLVTLEISRDLAKEGLVIVSGLAYGVDGLAHETTLEAEGKTIAVLGSGIDEASIYPSHHRWLARKIIEKGGAIISEYPLESLPLKQHFPHRNRIISGLSLGTLVVEAPSDSGALITAKQALEQNREVFAIPGNIYQETSIGPNNLIKMGARLVSSAQDILEVLNLAQALDYKESKKIIPETREEAILLEHLSYEPIHIDELIKLSKLETSLVASTLTMMEMKGKVRNLGGMSYVMAR